MGRAALLASALWLLGSGLAQAQALPGNSLPEGIFASEPEACAKLAAKTPAELGEDFDFEVLTKKGLAGYEQACDFVNVLGHDATSWVATAFCEESGYSYPDLFSIKQKEDGTLNVTRVTDLTQRGGDDANAQSDSGESDAPGRPEAADKPAAGDEAAEGGGAARDDQTASESYSIFVKCPNVKP
jgi:hypothetical protein